MTSTASMMMSNVCMAGSIADGGGEGEERLSEAEGIGNRGWTGAKRSTRLLAPFALGRTRDLRYSSAHDCRP